ncbi:SMAD/FHA domain-containing protein [Hesseltinella vesiculosa]|uniref:SMAD/FHA domain-containing protein n=1 Tax=Hesseltinella vesiculosa TaxID=101127 RepID=A0A1X2GBL1_9FUNG|nr:SMAD/FHA domain-containing protein [Hesseltinella vesiculosa]
MSFAIPAPRSKQEPKPPANAPPPLKYEKPEWGDVATFDYSLEVLKGGVSISKIHGPKKDMVTFGRLPLCDVIMEHPSLSRYHAVLQFDGQGDAYMYDLDSGYGTTVNKKPISPRTYVKLQTGDQIRFGESTRLYIFDSGKPVEEDETELEQEEPIKPRSSARAAVEQPDDQDQPAVTWGFPEDAQEEDDDDDHGEKGTASGDAQLLSVEAEKMAMVDAKRRRKDLEIMFGDDSDDDLYDMTDTRRRKAQKKEEKAETHEDLVKRQSQVEHKLDSLKKQMAIRKQLETKQAAEANDDGDLDDYMAQLTNTAETTGPPLHLLEKQLKDLERERARLVKLVKLTKPLF